MVLYIDIYGSYYSKDVNFFKYQYKQMERIRLNYKIKNVYIYEE